MDGDAADKVIWIEDGKDKPFEPAEHPRPWLEESLAWSSAGEGKKLPEKGGDTKLVWL